MSTLKSIEDQWNQKYRFISDGTWFLKDTQAELVCWYCNEPNIDTSLEQLNKLENVAGLFTGIRQCDSPDSEAAPYGQLYHDEEGCGLDEFQIVLRQIAQEGDRINQWQFECQLRQIDEQLREKRSLVNSAYQKLKQSLQIYSNYNLQQFKTKDSYLQRAMAAVIDFDLKTLEEMQQEVDNYAIEARATLGNALRQAKHMTDQLSRQLAQKEGNDERLD